MIFSDHDIEQLLRNKTVIIDPLPDLKVALGSCSIDLRLEGVRNYTQDYAPDIPQDRAPKFHDWGSQIVMVRGSERSFYNHIIIPPHGCVLASTIETVTLPNHIMAELHGRSSLARLFTGVHVTAGIIDAGWSGNIVLELVNHSAVPVTLRHGQRVCALTFEPLSSPTTRPYNQRENAKYRGQNGVVGSRLEQDKE